MSPLLTIEEITTRLGLSPDDILDVVRWLEEHNVRYLQIRPTYPALIPESEFERACEESLQIATPNDAPPPPPAPPVTAPQRTSTVYELAAEQFGAETVQAIVERSHQEAVARGTPNEGAAIAEGALERALATVADGR